MIMRRVTSFALAVLVTLLVPAGAAGQSGSTIATEKIFAALDVREGITVCEMGAGDGELSLAAARLVGAGGARLHQRTRRRADQGAARQGGGERARPDHRCRRRSGAHQFPGLRLRCPVHAERLPPFRRSRGDQRVDRRLLEARRPRRRRRFHPAGQRGREPRRSIQGRDARRQPRVSRPRAAGRRPRARRHRARHGPLVHGNDEETQNSELRRYEQLPIPNTQLSSPNLELRTKSPEPRTK